MNFVDVEGAITTAVREALPYVRTVETYAGQLEGEIETLALPFPAIFVVYGGSSFEWVDGRSYNEMSEFSVIVAAKNLKGSENLRNGEHGCYRMIADVLAALAHKNLGLAAIEPIKPVSVSLKSISKTAAAYEIDFRTRFDIDFSESGS